jgi:hypothetical protein
MWALVVVLAVGFGWSLVRLLPFKWYRLEAGAAAVAVGFALAPWVYFLAAGLLGWRIGLPLATVTLAAALGASELLVRRRLEFEVRPRVTWLRTVTWVAAGIVTVWFGWLVLSSYNFPQSGDWSSNGNVWGDSPLHVALVTQFSHQERLDLVSPVYERTALTYPLISDFWSGVLMRVSHNWVLSLAMPTLIMLWALLGGLYFGARRLLGSRTAAWLAWYMLVFSGPLLGAVKVVGALAGGTGDSSTVLTSLSNAGNYAYLNFFYSHPLPQRSYLFGMALFVVAAVVALELYRRRGVGAKQKPKLRVAGLLGGIMVGLMPLVHTHSFLVIAVLLGLATVALVLRERRLPAGWLELGVAGAVLAAPQVWWQEAHSYRGFSHVALGFTGAVAGVQHVSWPAFWLLSLGWLAVMLVAGWYFLRRIRAGAEVWVVYAAGVLIFVAGNVYVFQPSVWDNMKLFEYSVWFLMLASAAVFAAWSRIWWGRWAVGGLMLSLCAAGFITLVPGARIENYQLLSADEVRFGEHLQTALPANAYLLVGDRHNSPITMLSDRKVLMTYAGWYNLYGSDWEATWANRSAMLGGEPQAQALIKHYGVNFAAFSDSELTSGQINLQYFQSHYKLFDYQAGWWVFDLRQQP